MENHSTYIFDAPRSTRQIVPSQRFDFFLAQISFVNVAAAIINVGKAAKAFCFDFHVASLACTLVALILGAGVSASVRSFLLTRRLAVIAILVLIHRVDLFDGVTRRSAFMVAAGQASVAGTTAGHVVPRGVAFHQRQLMTAQAASFNFRGARRMIDLLHGNFLLGSLARQLAYEVLISGDNLHEIVALRQAFMRARQNFRAHLNTRRAITEVALVRQRLVVTL